VQLSINRPVGLKVLDTSRQNDPTAKGRFIADARAKAHVQHPSILSVYEAGESEGASSTPTNSSMARISRNFTPVGRRWMSWSP
jgi:hypothetical protein